MSRFLQISVRTTKEGTPRTHEQPETTNKQFETTEKQLSALESRSNPNRNKLRIE